MTNDPRFLACLPCTLIQECPLPNDWSNRRNFSNDAHDPGGATMCGIIQREYDIFRKSKGLPTRAVIQLEQAEGYEIYQTSYWLPDCPKLPAGLDLCLFDESVNAGPHEATKILQVALGIPADGSWGPQTDAAITGITDVAAVINAYTARREAFYRSLRGFQYFGADWIRRSAEIGAQAIKMVGS
jgi:lysozyme family protein